jgi:hypothetical protein
MAFASWAKRLRRAVHIVRRTPACATMHGLGYRSTFEVRTNYHGRSICARLASICVVGSGAARQAVRPIPPISLKLDEARGIVRSRHRTDGSAFRTTDAHAQALQVD